MGLRRAGFWGLSYLPKLQGDEGDYVSVALYSNLTASQPRKQSARAGTLLLAVRTFLRIPDGTRSLFGPRVILLYQQRSMLSSLSKLTNLN